MTFAAKESFKLYIQKLCQKNVKQHNNTKNNIKQINCM